MEHKTAFSVWFLPLALTLTENGACAAGLGEDGTWYRPEPVSKSLINGGATVLSYDTWRQVRLGPLAKPAPPENHRFLGFDSPREKFAPPEQRLELLGQVAHPSVADLFDGDQTLGCIRANIDDIYSRRHTGGRSFLRLVFSDVTGAQFDWVLPEHRVTQKWKAASEMQASTLVQPELLQGTGQDAYLTLALGDRNNRFPGKYDGRHPLVVGVHSIRELSGKLTERQG